MTSVRWLLIGLQLLFVALKLRGEIAWPWVAVVAPTWAPFAVLLVSVAVANLAWAMMSPKDRAIIRARQALRDYGKAIEKADRK